MPKLIENFTKADIKPGMLLETRQGGFYKPGYDEDSPDKLCFYGEGGSIMLSSKYDNNLRYIDKYGGKEWDIVRVYTPESRSANRYFKPDCYNKIWERVDILYLSIEEIAEKFSVPKDCKIFVVN